MSEVLRVAAQAIRTQLDEKVAAIKAGPIMDEVLKLKAALNALESVAGDPLTSLAQLFQMDSGSEVGPSPTTVRPDEFFGMQPLDAAKKYLKKRGVARAFDEIVSAIRSGGCRVESEDLLRLSLSRSTYEVAKISEDVYGLVEFYPDLKRERGGRKKKGVSEAQDAEIDREEMEQEIQEDMAILSKEEP